MFKKTCPSCGKDSFSASGRGEWYCPYCYCDLSAEPFKPASGCKEKEPRAVPKIKHAGKVEDKERGGK